MLENPRSFGRLVGELGSKWNPEYHGAAAEAALTELIDKGEDNS